MLDFYNSERLLKNTPGIRVNGLSLSVEVNGKMGEYSDSVREAIGYMSDMCGHEIIENIFGRHGCKR